MNGSKFSFPGKHILLVEDNLSTQELMVDMIGAIDCTLDIANNGEEAIAKWLNNDYDLVIMDLQMPVMDGYQTTMEIRKLENRTKKHTLILAITASAMSTDRNKCFKSGMDDYLTKPINIDMFEKKLAALFSRKP